MNIILMKIFNKQAKKMYILMLTSNNKINKMNKKMKICLKVY